MSAVLADLGPEVQVMLWLTNYIYTVYTIYTVYIQWHQIRCCLLNMVELDPLCKN